MKKQVLQKTEFREGKASYFQLQRRAFARQPTPAIRDDASLLRAAGNPAVHGLFNAGSAQAKLRIGQPDDIYETDADRVAEQVVAHPKRQTEDIPTRQLCRVPQVPEHDPLKEALADSLRTSGQPLQGSAGRDFESRFGWDLSKVRVHSDSTAAEAARSIHAKAFTTGRHIFFASGQYRPATFEGQKLIAHELTHVVQQQPDLVQRKTSDAETGTAWPELAKKAKTALASGDTVAAHGLYRQAILQAAGAVPLPEGLPLLLPAVDDIQLDLNMDATGETRCRAVAGNESNYWRWIYFGKSSVGESRAFTESVVTHELVHVNLLKKLLAQYQKQGSSNEASWEEYCRLHSPEARVLGPEEMEAEITSLGFMKRFNRAEQRLSLHGIFVAYAMSSAYVPPKGEKIGLTAEAAKPQILDFYKNADPDLKQEMGSSLWWGLIKADQPKEVWKKVLQDLKPIAIKGYSDQDFKPHYDAFLKGKGLSFADIVGANGEKAPPSTSVP